MHGLSWNLEKIEPNYEKLHFQGLQKTAHRSRWQSRDVKKCQWNLRAPWKSARQELRNEPPHDIAVWLPQNPFLASLIQTWSRGWPERDFGVVIQLCHVGARFEALDTLIFMAPSDFIGIFFTSLDCPLERCGWVGLLWWVRPLGWIGPGYYGESSWLDMMGRLGDTGF